MVALLAGSAIVALPGAAAAHGTDGGSESSLRREETRTLGPRHAAEHAAERAALRRWSALPAAARARETAREQRAATRATAAAGSPDQVGRWTDATVALPTWAINAAVLPTGKIAYWGRAPLVNGKRLNTGPFYLLDPKTGVSTHIDPPQETIDLNGDGSADDLAPAPIFCSGLSFLPSGELYVAGGNLFYPYYGAGHKDYGGFSGTYTFDPWTERWTTQPRMRHGRWYPTQAALPDGRTAIVSGYDEAGGGADNPDLELFTPAKRRGGVGTLTRYPAAEKVTGGFYPHLQALPGGQVSFLGSERGDARLLDPGALGDPSSPASPWTQEPDTLAYARFGGNAAVLPGTSRSIFLGGYDSGLNPAPDGKDFAAATKVVETIDWASPNPVWQTGAAGGVPDLNVARSYANLVGLPDGGYALVGGAAGFGGEAGNNITQGDQALKGVELWHPGEAAWRTGPPGAKWRGYHSTAVLLPDGRILSAGDDYWGFGDTPQQGPGAGGVQDKGEIYEPAYLFDGDQPAPRPTITAGPSAVRPGARFGIGVTETGGRRISRVTLVAPDAVTHSNNMNRAFADLPVERIDSTSVNVTAPADPGVTPPGWYMLFAWDESGTPSVARWVQIRASAPDAPFFPPATTPQPPTTTATTPTTPTDPGGGTTTPTTPTDPGGGSGGSGSGGSGGGSGGDGGGSGSNGGGSGSNGGGAGGGTAGGGDRDPSGPVSGAGSTPSTGTPKPGPAVQGDRGPKVLLAARIPTRGAKTVALRVGADQPGRIELRIRLDGRTQVIVVRPRVDRLSKTVGLRLGPASRRILRAGRTLRFVVRTSATAGAKGPVRRTFVLRVRPGRR